MKKFFQFHIVPLIVFIIAVLVAHGGNDKAPFLVIGASLFSLVVWMGYIAKSFAGGRSRNLKKSMVAGLPFASTAAIILAAKMGLVDPLPLLGFR